MQKYWKGEMEGLSEDPEGQVGWGKALVSPPASRCTAFPPVVALPSPVLEDSPPSSRLLAGSSTHPPGEPRPAACTSAAPAAWESTLVRGFCPSVPQIIP